MQTVRAELRYGWNQNEVRIKHGFKPEINANKDSWETI